MPLEVWGTFSVADHKRPRAFVADVLMYDRLVIPVPPKNDVAGWKTSGWEPAELQTRLDILGPELVRAVPWDEARRTQFASRYARDKQAAARRAEERLRIADAVEFDATNIRDAVAADPKVDPMFVTRAILVDHTNRKRDQAFFDRHPGVYVEAVAAYPSFDEFDAELDVEPLTAETPGSDADLAGVFGWEFFVPEDAALSDEDLLEEAAALARKKSFRVARTDFHEWRHELLAHGGDARTAVADMERKIDRYREESSKARTKSRILNAFTLTGGAASIAASFFFPPIGVAGGFIALARFSADKLLPGGALSQEARRGAMFADARKHFGWKG